MKSQALVLGFALSLMVAGCPATKSSGNAAADGGSATGKNPAGSSAADGAVGGKDSDGGRASTGSAGSSTAGSSGAVDGGSVANAGTSGASCALKTQACMNCNSGMCRAEGVACDADTACAGGNHSVASCICAAQTGTGTIDACVKTFKSAGGQLATTAVDCVVAKCGTLCGLN